MSRTWFRAAGIASTLVIALAACGGGAKPSTSSAPAGPTGTSGPAVKLPSCPVGALATATGKPVQITFWHAMVLANEETLKRLIDKFNASQSDVRVKLVNQSSYGEDFQKFTAGLTSGDLPDLVQIDDIRLQQMIDTRAILPVQSCINAEKYDTSDFVGRVLQYYSQNGVLYPMPFNVSNPVLYYDKNAFTKAGLDPNRPPASLDEVKADAQKIKAAGYKAGFALKLDPWPLEHWSAIANVDYVDNGNGRNGRATKAVFDNATARQVFAWMSDMVRSGLAVTNSATGPSSLDNLLAIATHTAAMTIDTSAALGTISQRLAAGQAGGAVIGVGPMPGPGGPGSVLVGGAALYISAKSSPEKQAAAWMLAKFLADPANQADWAAGTGYVPIRKSSISLPAIQQLWATNPYYRVAWDQLIKGVATPATAGPVIGDYQGVRDAVLAAEQAMFTQGLDPGQALAQAERAATAKMQEYNSRVE